MAITKIHPIRRTLNRAVKYITNPKKTEDELYVSCYGCTRETLTEEFKRTRLDSGKESPVLAQHLIQSFRKDEVTPELAHQIGKELADRFTEGKHEYIIATHLDKGCIHNHIIFNHISFADHSCFHSDAKKLRALRSLNDRICKEHGLSVIDEPKGKGKSYYEWAMDKMNRSYKSLLRDNIDSLIPKVGSYEELLDKLCDLGYEIKRGKYDAFRLDDQQKFTRLRSLGPGYSREEITDRIEHPENESSYTQTARKALILVWKYDQKLGLIENTGNYLLFIESNYQRRQIAIQDTKKLAATYNLLKERGIDSVYELDNAIKDEGKSIREQKDRIIDMEGHISEINTFIKYAERIEKYRPVYDEYLSEGKSTNFYESHRTEIALYESSVTSLKKLGLEQDNFLLEALRNKRDTLEDEKLELSSQYNIAKSEYNNLIIAKKNVEAIINEGLEEEREQDARNEQYKHPEID